MARRRLEGLGGQDSGWWSRRSHIHVWINWKNNWGVRQTTQPRVPAQGNKASKTLAIKTCGACSGRRKPSLTGEFVGEAHRVLEFSKTHPPGNQHWKGPICLWVAGEVTERQRRAEQVALLPHGPFPNIQQRIQPCGLPLPWEIPKAPGLTA